MQGGINMANKIQIRRGLKSKLPTLSSGEPGYCTDTKEFFVGTGSGNVNMGGSHWYTGTEMSGTSTSSEYSYASCPDVKVGDMYLNTSYGYTYQCKTAGKGTEAKWQYKGSIRGAQGSYPAVDSSLSSSSVNPVQNKVIKSELDEKLDGSWSDANGYENIYDLSLDVMDMWQYFRDGLAPMASITIGCVDSSYSNLLCSNYMCMDNQDHTSIFQKAINSLPSDGGKIVILNGSYKIASKLTCNKNIIIEGMGDGTIINVEEHGFLYNTTANNITIKNIKFNCTGAFSDSNNFIEYNSNSNVIIDNCTIEAVIDSIDSPSSNYIVSSGNLIIIKSRIFMDIRAYTNVECFAIVSGTYDYDSKQILINSSSITLYNCFNTTISSTSGTTADAYILRNKGKISDCKILCRGKSNSTGNYKAIANVTYDSDIIDCNIELGNDYTSLQSYNGSLFSRNNITGNTISLYTGYVGGRCISNNRFAKLSSSKTVYFNGPDKIITNNHFINNKTNDFASLCGSIIFKDNVLKYPCEIHSLSTNIVKDNLINSTLN